MIAPVIQPFGIVLGAVAVIFVIINAVQPAGLYLETPKSRAVVNAKIPRNMHWHIVSNIDLRDAAIAFGLREFKCKISAGDDARKAALVFLIVERVAGYFAIER